MQRDRDRQLPPLRVPRRSLAASPGACLGVAEADVTAIGCRHPLTLAYEFQELLEAGVVNNRAELARRCGLSRARVTQVMSLLHLPDEIQEYVMALPPGEQRLYSGRRLQGVAGIRDEAAQTDAFEDLAKDVSRTAGA